jgi:hypothetical protein
MDVKKEGMKAGVDKFMVEPVSLATLDFLTNYQGLIMNVSLCSISSTSTPHTTQSRTREKTPGRTTG